MFDLDALQLERLLRLAKLGWRLIEPPTAMDGGVVWLHGDRVSKHAAYAVKAVMESRFFQQSVLMGHTHRIGAYSIRGPNYPRMGYELGCLCTLEPEYVKHPNWMQGMAITTYPTDPESNKLPGVEQVVFEGRDRVRRAFFRGKEYIAK